MKGYVANIEEEVAANKNFRKVLYTGKYAQLVVMNLKPGEEIGMEVHVSVDQFFRIEEGSAKFVIDGEESEAGVGFVVIVPAGSQHNVINASKVDELELYTLYSPPNHPEGTVHATKADAEAAEKAEHGK
jgi:mannose-6-phosphate isomerase-like protein (cupin superfamily)